MSKDKKKCEHLWQRVWLASNKYRLQFFCKKCFAIKNHHNGGGGNDEAPGQKGPT